MHTANLLAVGLSAYIFAVLTYYGKFDLLGASWFPWHPLCMVVAFLITPVAAIVYKSPKHGGGGKENTIMHGNLMTGAALVGSAGWYVEHLSKEAQGKAHITSYHAQAGLVCLFFFIVGSIGSYMALHPDTGSLKTNTTVRKTHKLSLRAAIALAFVTILTGFSTIVSTALVGVLAAGMLALGLMVLQ
jgi:hypothetical protein